MVSSDHAGNGLRLKRSGSRSQSLYMSVRSATNESLGDPAVLLLPGAQIVDRERVVGVLGEIERVVEHDQRQHHLLERNAVHGDAVLGEMRRRIDMGAVLPDHLIVGRAEAVLRDGVGLAGLRIDGRRHLRLAEARPHRRVRPEAVGEVDEAFSGENASDGVEIVRSGSRRWRAGQGRWSRARGERGSNASGANGSC